jgi:hypothetical protein
MATEPVTDNQDEVEAPSAAQKRMRAEAFQRLQVGLAGLAAMLLLVSLANILIDRRNETEQAAVPETAASADEAPAKPANKDPLVDAGVVPQLPAEPVGGPGAGSAGANAPPTSSN